MLRSKFSQTFEVLVGQKPKQRCFTVHKDIFCRRSAFLKAATSICWTSGVQRAVDLTDHDPDVFDAYMQCVYIDNVVMSDVDELVPLYLLADKLNDLTTANLTMDEILRLSDESRYILNKSSVRLAYDFTTAGNPLHTICRDYYVHDCAPDEFLSAQKAELPYEMVLDVALEFSRLAQQKGSRGQHGYKDDIFQVACVTREKCHYHQHNDDHPKCS